jgi:putative FmdB family regulatory protein
MPVYEYQCSQCDEKFELRRNIADKDSDVRCPKCGTKAPKRVLSLFSTTCSRESCSPGPYSGST